MYVWRTNPLSMMEGKGKIFYLKNMNKMYKQQQIDLS